MQISMGRVIGKRESVGRRDWRERRRVARERESACARERGRERLKERGETEEEICCVLAFGNTTQADRETDRQKERDDRVHATSKYPCHRARAD